MTAQLAEPRSITDATEVINNPHRYRDQPTLMHMARLLLMSRAGATPRQTGPLAGRPALIRSDRSSAKGGVV